MEHQWNEIDRGKPTTRRKTCPSATLSTTNLTLDLTWDRTPGLRGERPATNRLSHGTALREYIDMYENVVVRGIFGPKSEKVTGVWKNCTLRSLVICALNQISMKKMSWQGHETCMTL
jgi:hypothetical protein